MGLRDRTGALTSVHAGEPLLAVRDLTKVYATRRRGFSGANSDRILAIDSVSFSIWPGEVLGLVGESGCGKSTTGMALMLQEKVTSGEIIFRGIGPIKQARGKTRLAFTRAAQLVFQNPYEAFNPRHTIRESISEPIKIHFPGDPAHQEHLLLQAMERSGLHPPENYLDRFPHQLSGGQLQRIAIARAIAIEPKFLVADEPVAMLDVSVRATVLNLFRKFADDLGMAILYISHDISTMRYACSRIAVMYLGRIIEIGPTEDILKSPRHPFTKALIAAVPSMNGQGRVRGVLDGASTSARPLRGCAFQPRCPAALPKCAEQVPALREISGGCGIACHLINAPEQGAL
jgi:oligopeptide/dipeptide ABC transporter ATP-binding protein